MFSKTIFKQTLKQNWKLWAIFTGLTAAMGAVIMVVFDPRRIQQFSDMLANLGVGGGEGVGGIGEMLGSFTLLGMLGDTFYGFQGLILPLVFVIMTANSLVASQVDRGSMAYTLSTPIKRIKVVCTQAIYLITAVFAMFAVVTLAGLGAVQVAHNGLWGEPHTPDVIAAAEILGVSRDEVRNDINLIANSPEALAAGAQARRIDEDIYAAYLTLKTFDNALNAAADILGIGQEETTEDLSVLLESDEAIEAMSAILWMEPSALRQMIQAEIDEHANDGGTDDAMQQAMM